MLFLVILVIVVSTGVVWKGSDFLENSSQKIAKYYNLPPIVKGTIITAIGSSFPELSTTVISTVVHGEFNLGVSAIVGSAIFNILVIPALSGLIGGPLSSDRILVYKDAQFYLTAIMVLLLVFSMAVIYRPVEAIHLKGNITRWMALFPLLIYFLYLFLQQQETADYQKDMVVEKNNVKIGKEWIKLIASLVLIIGGVEGLVRGAIFLGEYFNTPNFFWGVTIVAAATSIPDAFVSIKVAKKKEGDISLANVLGSNIFDLLVAVPVGVLIAGSSTIDFSIAVPMMGFLILSSIVLFTFMRTGLVVTVTESWLFLVLYLMFVVWMILETLGIIKLVGVY